MSAFGKTKIRIYRNVRHWKKSIKFSSTRSLSNGALDASHRLNKVPIPLKESTARMKGAKTSKAHASILSLDKSELPFAEQLQEAYLMLGLDIQSLSNDSEAFRIDPSLFSLEDGINGPRHEWALKWILNKLHGDIGHGSPCLEPKAWILLRCLMIVTSPAKIAQILKGKKYLGAVRRTLAWLRSNSEGCPDYRYDINSESGSDDNTNAKKRKRDNSDFETHKSDFTCFELMSALMLPICETLHQVQGLIEHQPVASITTEQLKIALRYDSEVAASIVGDAFHLLFTIYKYISIYNPETDSRIAIAKGWQSMPFEHYTRTYVELWSLQSSGRGDLDNAKLHAFTKSCLLSTLLLLHTLQLDLLERCPTESSINMLEVFIAVNAVEPLQRSSDMTVHSWFADLDELVTERLRSSLLPKLTQGDERQLLPRKKRRKTKYEVYLMSKLVFLFFEIAITHTSRETSKARKEGNSFLQSLFDELKKSLAMHLGPDASESRPAVFSRAVNALLNQAVKNDVPLRANTIESILRKVSGLFDETETQQVDWNIVSLCLKSNVDVFLIPQKVVSGIKPHMKTNETLKKIYAKLETPSDANLSIESDRLYGLKLKGVIIPLMRAYASARDLAAFFELWKNKLQESATPHIWADDDLLFTAQEIIDACLPAEQASMILEGIEPHLAGIDPKHTEAIASDLVMLDCVVGGQYGEDSRSRLSSRVISVYSTLATSFLKSPETFHGLAWRVWRILTNVNQRWLCGDFVSSALSISRELHEKASQTIDTPGEEAMRDGVCSLQEQCFAFGFVTSLSSFSNRTPEVAVEFREKLNKSVNKVIDSNGLLCQQLEGDLFRVLKPIEDQHKWSGESTDISSHDKLYLSCIARLLSQSAAVGCLDGETQKRLLNQLSLLSRHERRLRDSPESGIDYAWLWNYAEDCEAVYEVTTFAQTLRNIQCKNFTRLLGSEQPLHLRDSLEERTLAMKSLLCTSSGQFSAEDRIEIADDILEDLKHWKDSSRISIARHLQLLVKIVDVPRKISKRMKVFENIHVEGDHLQDRSAIFVLAKIVGQNASLMERPACDNALCHLTRIILRYIYDTLTTDSSARYFTMFHQWIGAEMDREYTENPVCSDDWTSTGSMLLVSMTALNFYHENRSQLSIAVDPGSRVIDNIRKGHFERVLRICSNQPFHLRMESDRIELAANLECLYGYIDLFLAHPSMLQVHERLLKLIEDNERGLGMDDYTVTKEQGELYALFLRISYKIPLFKNPDALAGQLIPWNCLERGRIGHRKLLEPQAFEDYVSTLDGGAIEKILPLMPQDYQRHVILGLTDIQKSNLQSCITRSFLNWNKMVQDPCDWTAGIAAIRCIIVLLRKCPKQVSQYMIEDLLSTITSSASKMDCRDSGDSFAKAFTGLCRLFSTILEYHRPKLGGRYHLTVPVLQALIQQLFTPYAKEALVAQRRSPLDASHASIFARILTTLCDPSPSAVSYSRPRQQIHLNDETKRAKETAGQHLHYLIMTYCECRINGRFAAEGMKEALEPGLWAVVGCLGDDIRRTMNAAMDPNCRAVWKKLYEDWKEFGEWQAGQKPR